MMVMANNKMAGPDFCNKYLTNEIASSHHAEFVIKFNNYKMVYPGFIEE